jgi:hypothetical protein
MPLFASIIIELRIPSGMHDIAVDKMIMAYEDLILRDDLKDLVIGRLRQRDDLDPIAVQVYDQYPEYR